MRTPLRIVVGCLTLAALALGARPAEAAFTFRSVTNTNPGNAAIGEAQLSMTVEDAGGNQVRFRISNSGPESLAVTDVFFDDDNLLGVIAGGAAGSDPSVVFAFNPALGPFPPSGPPLNPEFETTIRFTASSSATGIGPGESLALTFDLLGGHTFQDVIAALNAGAELEAGDSTAGTLRVGLVARNFASGDDDTESFLNEGESLDPAVPAPPALVLLASAIPVLGLRRLLRRRTV